MGADIANQKSYHDEVNITVFYTRFLSNVKKKTKMFFKSWQACD